MSDFKFDCPKCGQNIVCDTSNAGMNIPCPVCQTMLTVPAPPQSATTPPAAAAGPAKLSINRTAHHQPSQPPPGASNAPPKPAWGTKPAAYVAPKKKFPWVTVSVISGLLIVAAVGWFGFGAPYLKEKARKEQEAKDEADRQAAAAKAQADAEAARIRRAKAADWTLEPGDANFPDRPASGRIHGNDFAVDTVIFLNGFLTLRQSSGNTRQFQIPVQFKPGEKVSGKTIQFLPNDTGPDPRIGMSWKEDSPKPPGAVAFGKGYLMKLEFGEPAGGKLPGKIYLCVPDDSQSYVAGNFEITPRTPGASPAPGQPGGPPPPRRERPPPH